MKINKNMVGLFLCLNGLMTLQAQTYSLDSCRRMAIANNKSLLISGENINRAANLKDEAHTEYLPKFTVSGNYMRNQYGTKVMSSGDLSQLNTALTGMSGLLSKLSQQTIDLSPLGSKLKSATDFDTRNVFAGVLNVTQPVYMGGRIKAYNEIARYAEQLAIQMHEEKNQDVIVNTDEAYWQVVSLANKVKLANGYLNLLAKMDSDIQKMIAQGVATKADGLSVAVKKNEAEISLTKAEDGLDLSKMLLCEICGIPISTQFKLTDENLDNLSARYNKAAVDVETAYQNRPELKSLGLNINIQNQKVKLEEANYLPTVVAMGNYIVTNPNFKDGFEKKFAGMWNVGVNVTYPLWDWDARRYKVNMAKADARIAQYELADAREKIELQVNQSVFKVNEAGKKLTMANKNMEKAEENLRSATIGFDAGVIPASTALEAHTAWLQAKSEKIDAEIEVKLTDLYLQKSLGTLTNNTK